MKGFPRFGVIGGAGWLGSAIAQAMISAKVTRLDTLSISFRSRKADGFEGAYWTNDNQDLVDKSDVIILSVRPQDWPTIEVDAAGKLVISVMAGVTMESLRRGLSCERVVRALPNAAAEVLCSYTPWIASVGVNDSDRAVVQAIFGACGNEDEVESEKQIDYLTGLTGSGPAFPALLTTAMIKHAKANGLPPEIARKAVKTILTGTGRLFERHDYCPEQLVDTFVGYNGTTAAAIQSMRDAGFCESVYVGLAAAFNKSVSMGDAS